MIRVVIQHSEALHQIVGLLDRKDLPNELTADGVTFFKVKTKRKWALYKRAISGWGAASSNPAKTFDPRQV